MNITYYNQLILIGQVLGYEKIAYWLGAIINVYMKCMVIMGRYVNSWVMLQLHLFFTWKGIGLLWTVFIFPTDHFCVTKGICMHLSVFKCGWFTPGSDNSLPASTLVCIPDTWMSSLSWMPVLNPSLLPFLNSQTTNFQITLTLLNVVWEGIRIWLDMCGSCMQVKIWYSRVKYGCTDETTGIVYLVRIINKNKTQVNISKYASILEYPNNAMFSMETFMGVCFGSYLTSSVYPFKPQELAHAPCSPWSPQALSFHAYIPRKSNSLMGAGNWRLQFSKHTMW